MADSASEILVQAAALAETEIFQDQKVLAAFLVEEASALSSEEAVVFAGCTD